MGYIMSVLGSKSWYCSILNENWSSYMCHWTAFLYWYCSVCSYSWCHQQNVNIISCGAKCGLPQEACDTTTLICKVERFMRGECIMFIVLQCGQQLCSLSFDLRRLLLLSQKIKDVNCWKNSSVLQTIGFYFLCKIPWWDETRRASDAEILGKFARGNLEQTLVGSCYWYLHSINS